MSQMEEVDSMTIPPLVLPTHVGQEAREECNRLCGKAEQAHAEYTKLAYRLASATIGNKGTKAPDFVKRMTELGYLIMGGSPEQMAEMLKGEVARWTPIVKASGAKAD